MMNKREGMIKKSENWPLHLMRRRKDMYDDGDDEKSVSIDCVWQGFSES
jgi:hypothetical protein